MKTIFTPVVRRYGYAIGEIVSIIIVGICFPVLFLERGAYRLGANDPGMAKITSICFMAISIGMFVLCNSLKQIDNDK